MKRKKRAITLIEIMIVILLIGLIGGALAFNMRGSMDKGRVFKTQQNAARVYDALMMEYAKGERTLQQIIAAKKDILKKSPLIKDPDTALRDGWGEDFSIVEENSDLVITSQKAQAWEDAHKVQ